MKRTLQEDAHRQRVDKKCIFILRKIIIYRDVSVIAMTALSERPPDPEQLRLVG